VSNIASKGRVEGTMLVEKVSWSIFLLGVGVAIFVWKAPRKKNIIYLFVRLTSIVDLDDWWYYQSVAWLNLSLVYIVDWMYHWFILYLDLEFMLYIISVDITRSYNSYTSSSFHFKTLKDHQDINHYTIKNTCIFFICYK